MQTSLLPTSLGNILYDETGSDIIFAQVFFSREMGGVKKLCNRNNDIFLGLFADKINILFNGSCYTLDRSYILLCLPILKADATDEIVEQLKNGARLKARPDKVFTYKNERYIPVALA